MEKFLKPTFSEIINEENKENINQSKFIIEKLERGFGNTLGIAIRRTLLSSIPSVVPFAIELDGSTHEFQGIEHVTEDVAEIILNLKKIVLKVDYNLVDEDEILEAKLISSSGPVRVDSFVMPVGVEIVNNDLIIAHTSKDRALNLKIYLRFSKGYKTFEENRSLVKEKLGESKNIIPIDSNFSPIKNVNFNIEEVNPGESYVYERLTIDILTKGNISPRDAIGYAGAILKNHYATFENMAIIDTTKVDDIFEEEKIEEEDDSQLLMTIEELNLSVRSQNGLEKAGINVVGELIDRPFSALKQIENLGDKSVSEIVEAIQNLGLSFKIE